jgi:hypothetical protein
MEAPIYRRCHDLVENCVVVGNGRPQPALFAEVHERVVRPEMVEVRTCETKSDNIEDNPDESTKITGSKVTPSWWNTLQVQRRIEELKLNILARIKEDMELRYVPVCSCRKASNFFSSLFLFFLFFDIISSVTY